MATDHTAWQLGGERFATKSESEGMVTVTSVVSQPGDERVMQQIASVLRANDAIAAQVRAFAENIEEEGRPNGLKFQPKPGTLLVCYFGLGFQVPEIVKVRPVLVISPHQRHWSGLCTVVPISSKRPDPILPYHYQLPVGSVPRGKYEESWIKGDLVMSVGAHRLDRFKTGFRRYEAPNLGPDVLKEVRRCVLHATGMHALTEHL